MQIAVYGFSGASTFRFDRALFGALAGIDPGILLERPLPLFVGCYDGAVFTYAFRDSELRGGYFILNLEELEGHHILHGMWSETDRWLSLEEALRTFHLR